MVDVPLSNRSLSNALLALLFFLSSQRGQSMPEYSCNICRDPPSGERALINGEKTFTQSNGVTTSCNELQEWVQDVDPTPTGAPGEAFLCATTQFIAELNCECSGPDIPSMNDSYIDPNPACDLCGLPGLDFNFVPFPNQGKLTDTVVVGRQNCEGLYLAAAEGIFTSNVCRQVQQNSGPDCCNLEVVVQPRVGVTPRPTPPPTPQPTAPPSPQPTPVPTSPPMQICLSTYETCSLTDSTMESCCNGLECRVRSIGSPPVCSLEPRNERSRIGGTTGRVRVRSVP